MIEQPGFGAQGTPTPATMKLTLTGNRKATTQPALTVS